MCLKFSVYGLDCLFFLLLKCNFVLVFPKQMPDFALAQNMLIVGVDLKKMFNHKMYLQWQI